MPDNITTFHATWRGLGSCQIPSIFSCFLKGIRHMQQHVSLLHIMVTEGGLDTCPTYLLRLMLFEGRLGRCCISILYCMVIEGKVDIHLEWSIVEALLFISMEFFT
jgi:hypothetical protein